MINSDSKSKDSNNNDIDNSKNRLKQALENNYQSTLRCISLIPVNAWKLDEECTDMLYEALRTNTTVSELHIGFKSDDEVGTFVHNVLYYNSSIETLHVGYSEMNNYRGLLAIFNPIKNNNTLKSF